MNTLPNVLWIVLLLLVAACVILGAWAQVTSPDLVGQVVDCYLTPAMAGSAQSGGFPGLTPSSAGQSQAPTTNCWYTTVTSNRTMDETVAGLGGLILLLVGLYVGASRLPETLLRQRLQRRIDQVGATAHEPDEASPLVKGRIEGPLPAVDRLLGATERGFALGRWIEQSGAKVSLSSIALMAMTSAVGVGLVAGMAVRHPMATLVGGLAGTSVPFLVLHVKRAKRFRRFEEQFPEALDLTAQDLQNLERASERIE